MNQRPITTDWQFGLLYAIAFFMPLYEAPKNLLVLAFVIVWGIARWRDRDLGGPWQPWDTLILALMISGFLEAAFAAVPGNEWRGAWDLVRFGLPLLLLRRSRIGGAIALRLVFWLLTGCVIALAWGWWRHQTQGATFIELHSVGHVNHSAVYVAQCAALALATALFAWEQLPRLVRWGLLLALAFLAAGLVAMESRAAVGVFAVAATALALAAWPRSRQRSLILLAALAIAAATLVVAKPGVVQRQIQAEQRGDVTNLRWPIWNRALYATQINPWFGVGMDNFGAVGDELIRPLVEAEGRTFTADQYHRTGHAHNLVLNTLVERGIIGALPAFALLLAWGVALLRRRPGPATAAPEATLWGGALAAWLLTLLVGLVNTTFHHELALLAMLQLGAWMALKQNTAPSGHPDEIRG